MPGKLSHPADAFKDVGRHLFEASPVIAGTRKLAEWGDAILHKGKKISRRLQREYAISRSEAKGKLRRVLGRR